MIFKSVVIVGAGPAGITSAIQLKRAGIDFVLLEKGDVGGLLLNANLIENYPGLNEPLSGPMLVKRFKDDLSRHNIKVTTGDVVDVNVGKSEFHVKTLNETYSSTYLIIASGTRPVKLEDPPQKVYYDVYSLLNVSNSSMVIIGGGDAAFDYALNLAKNNNRISILFRKKEPTCLPLLYSRAVDNPLIKIYPETEFDKAKFTCDYLLAAIGREPCVDFISSEYVNNRIENLFFVGDVVRGVNRQLSIAVGDGMLAAQNIIKKESK